MYLARINVHKGLLFKVPQIYAVEKQNLWQMIRFHFLINLGKNNEPVDTWGVTRYQWEQGKWLYYCSQRKYYSTSGGISAKIKLKYFYSPHSSGPNYINSKILIHAILVKISPEEHTWHRGWNSWTGQYKKCVQQDFKDFKFTPVYSTGLDFFS